MPLTLHLLLSLPFLAAAVVAALPRTLSRGAVSWTAAAAPLVGLVLLGLMSPAVIDGDILRASLPWIPSAGLDLSLRLDGLAWMFAGLVLGIGALIVMYAHYYLDSRDNAPRFYSFLLLFMGAMLGMVLSGNLLLLVVFWELTSISSFLLIGFWSHRQDARQGARMALTVTATGGIALVYLATIVLGFFGVSIPLIHESGLVGIGFSLFVVVIAALNLVLDFDFIETGVEQGAPKYMEWYGAFGLMVTLVWLYIEFLRLLSKLQSRN